MDYPLYILVINDEAKTSTICRRVVSTAPAPPGSYVPYAVGSRPEMKTLYKDLTAQNQHAKENL